MQKGDNYLDFSYNSQHPQNHLHQISVARGTRRMVLVVNFFEFLKLFFLLCCCYILIFDLVHDVEMLTANSVWKSFLKYE